MVDVRPPQDPGATRVSDSRTSDAAPVRDGIIEAVARSVILGFPEDVVVRVRVTADGTRIDVRSASRYGRSDLGSNAARVRDLVSDIDDVLSKPAKEIEPEKAPPPPPHQDRGRSARR